MIVLGIESTCDETGAAIARSYGESRAVEILSDVKASSAEVLSKYGGVVPEVAAREQVAAIIPVIQMAIENAKLIIDNLDAIAVTQGPGLIGSLLVGVETAKALALAWKKPLIPVNHMAAHVFANWIRPSTANPYPPSPLVRGRKGGGIPELPAVALIVSGGHTDLMLMRSLTDWKWIGGTRDDAAGEAFDKAARAMGFPYPGGPEIAKMAMQKSEVRSQFRQSRESSAKPGKSEWMRLPRPMIYEDNLEMSFSGLKTAVVHQLANGVWHMDDDEDRAMLANEFNQAVVDVLTKKTVMAVERHKPKSVLLAGGVAANSLLRQELAEKLKNSRTQNIKLFVPDLKYCTDNAAMVAACALLRPTYVDPLSLQPNPGLEIR